MVDDAFRLFKSTREWLSPKLVNSAFIERGILTPEEFVRAGDHLISVCPSWKWETGDINKLRPYLPKDKQFLSTNGVPCYRRVTELEKAELIDVLEDNNSDSNNNNDWYAPSMIMPINDDDDAVFVEHDDINIEKNNEITKTEIAKATIENFDNEELEDDSLALDDATIPVKVINNEKLENNSIEECGIIRSRRYDVSITYDNYYKTPRVWLFGYDENGTPLSPISIFQDIMQDYARKTVTIDPHPHMKHMHASIHPCQHAAAMLRILEALNECGKVPDVDQYLFIFLKFIQSVIPTIEYDYTVAIEGLRLT